MILGVVTVIASLIYIFGMQKRSGNYSVNQPSASVPLKPKQLEQTVELELS